MVLGWVGSSPLDASTRTAGWEAGYEFRYDAVYSLGRYLASVGSLGPCDGSGRGLSAR